MGDGALRGTRLGSTSYESDAGVDFAPRQMTTYDCPEGHATTLPFAEEAEIPYDWECATCGRPATLRHGTEPDRKPEKPVRTHWDMLLERRSIPELEELLDERLGLLRAMRGEGVRRSA
ncbi:MAG TPA: RNA polymerase-binding protein RbpA [Candidatus Nanopelagicales bacterium]